MASDFSKSKTRYIGVGEVVQLSNKMDATEMHRWGTQLISTIRCSIIIPNPIDSTTESYIHLRWRFKATPGVEHQEIFGKTLFLVPTTFPTNKAIKVEDKCANGAYFRHWTGDKSKFRVKCEKLWKMWKTVPPLINAQTSWDNSKT